MNSASDATTSFSRWKVARSGYSVMMATSLPFPKVGAHSEDSRYPRARCTATISS